jgi:hypothetical protein
MAALIALVALGGGCGGEVATSEGSPEDPSPDGIRGEESAPLQWWNAAYTSQSMSYGWHDTDLAVSSSTPIQLRNSSRLIAHGVYGWGYMPTFVDTVTGKTFRFLHLRPQHQYATEIGRTYPAGFIVGLSGGDTKDTGYGVYSTGAHLCVQTPGDTPFRVAFPAGGGGSNGGASCHSSTLNRTVGASTCVQSAADGNWYTCENGAWVAGQHSCGVEYPFCHSATLGRYVPARTCVESKYDHIWYQCNHNGWDTPVSNGAGPVGGCSAEYGL